MDLGENLYNRPTVCKQCGGIMIFKGVGEYHCEDCGFVDFDDYGLVRGYIEKHPGATAAEVEAETGVKQRTIRQMLKDAKLEVASDSKAFLRCEICGISIRSGRFCPQCESTRVKVVDAEKRAKLQIKGTGMGSEADEGAKRFKRTY